VIYKPLTTAPISGGRVLYTTPITDDNLDLSVAYTAHLFQSKIEKEYEVRVTVVDSTVLAARIDAITPAAKVDWRSDPDGVRYSSITLPDDVADKLRRLVAKLRLRFAAIDLVVDTCGQVWFLEANPNGQWAWIEDATGLPITAAIADALLRDPE